MICKMYKKCTKILKITIQIKKRKVLIVFDDMIADMINNEKLNSIVTKLFTRGRKLNISIFFFIRQSHFRLPKDVRLNSTNFFIMKVSNKRELKKSEYTAEPYSFLVDDTTLPSDNPLRFRKNLLT